MSADYSDAEQAALMLRDRMPVGDLMRSPAQGCCGCGSWLADVNTHPSDGYPYGEGYCWGCVDGKYIPADRYVVLEGRQR